MTRATTEQKIDRKTQSAKNNKSTDPYEVPAEIK